MAQQGDIKIEILDSQTRQCLPHTTIDSKVYVTAAEGKDFIIRAKLVDHRRHQQNYPDCQIRARVYIDGECCGYVKELDHCGEVLIDYRLLDSERVGLRFQAPRFIEPRDPEEAKANKEANEKSDIGTIQVSFAHTRVSAAPSWHMSSTGAHAQQKSVGSTKKFMHRPNIGGIYIHAYCYQIRLLSRVIISCIIILLTWI